MTNESSIEITLTPEGTDLAVIVDFQDPSLDEERLEQLTISLLKEIKAGFAPVEVERLAAQDLPPEGVPKGLEDLGKILPGIFKAVLKAPKTLKSLLVFLVDCLPQKTFALKFKGKKKYFELKISGFNEEEISIFIESSSSIAQRFFERNNQ